MPDRPHSLLPRLPLDDLLAEVQARLEAVRVERDGVRSLLDAVVSIGEELELEAVLRRIVEAARSLADARYAALGVIGEDRQLAEFIPLGVTEEQIAKIEHWPHGHGLLGLLIREPQTLRLADLSKHPESYGFPKGHPEMSRFLGVPIRIRDEVFGNLYLTDKSSQQEFDEQDAAIVDALAAAAGVAIDNARRYEETRARELWLEASGAVTRELLSGAASSTALEQLARRAREMANAETALVVLPGNVDGTLAVIAADGSDADVFRDVVFPAAGSLSGSVIESGQPLTVVDLHAAAKNSPIAASLPAGPALFVPLAQAERTRGVLAVHRRKGGIPFTGEMVKVLAAFAAQVAVVMELADARHEAERYGLIDDRARIARDLHDLVIQRLFASAMTLTGTARLISEPAIARRVEGVVDDLDETIRQIRSSIFALQTTERNQDPRLRARIVNIIESISDRFGYAPSVQMNGLLDTDVPDEVAGHAIAVLQEAVSNVIRHASAEHVDVVVELVDEQLSIHVADDGVGMGDGGRRSGLANLADRADRLNGSFDVRSRPEGGTILDWQVPVHSAHSETP